jgi:prevent-host-death family protein
VKTIGLKEAKAHLSRFVDNAQHERILIMRRGRPAALVIGVEGHDIERIVLGSDAEFWKMIERRRKTPATLTSDDMRRSFGIPTRPQRRRTNRTRRKS